MSYVVAKTNLTRVNQPIFMKIWKTSFDTTALWKNNVPYPDDPIWYVSSGDCIVGFCMVHESTPPGVDVAGPGAYFYNLCVLPNFRNQGVATKIIETLKLEYPDGIYCHQLTNSKTIPKPNWLLNHGWVFVGNWRTQLDTFYWNSDVEARELASQIPEEQKSWPGSYHYDPVENVVYL